MISFCLKPNLAIVKMRHISPEFGTLNINSIYNKSFIGYPPGINPINKRKSLYFVQVPLMLILPSLTYYLGTDQTFEGCKNLLDKKTCKLGNFVVIFHCHFKGLVKQLFYHCYIAKKQIFSVFGV